MAGGEDVAGFTPRQQQVLTAALDVLVAEGDRLTMTAVARQGELLQGDALQVVRRPRRAADGDGAVAGGEGAGAAGRRRGSMTATLRQSLEQFARDLLATIAGEVSVTLNRLAVTHAGTDSGLGAIMLEHGPAAIRRRLKPVLEPGGEARLLRFDDSEEAYRTFFGLVVRDTQIRLLLGETHQRPIVDKETRGCDRRSSSRSTELTNRA